MGERLLLSVEGQDDKHVIWAILEHHGFEPHFNVKDEEGYENLHNRLSPRLKPGTDLERYGIVVDADQDLPARWQSIRDVLTRAGYAGIPALPDPAGTVVDHEDLPRLGVWIMPDNLVPGMLEDYMVLLVPEGDSLIDHARRCLDEIPADRLRFAPVHRTKALIHTWLSRQQDPGTPLGQAITKRYFRAESPHVAAFLSWLTRVYG